jgi:hypothetical protein
MFAKHERLGSIWVRTIYWYLDQYSCVLVRRNRLWFEEAVPVLEQLWKTIEEERSSGFEHRAPSKRKAAGAGAGAAAGAESETVFKIVKLDTAIVAAADDTTTETATTAAAKPEITATNMAKLMSLNTNNNNNTHKKYGYGYGGAGLATKRPSDVLINCFKIDDLEIDESKVD